MIRPEAVPQDPGALDMTRSYLNTLICGLLLGYVAVLPFKPLLVLERNGFLVLLGLLAVWCGLNRSLFFVRTPYDTMLLAFVLWVGFTLPFSVAPLYSLKEYGKLLQYVVVFYAVAYFLREIRYRQALFTVVGVVTIVLVGYGLTQFNLADGQAVRSFFPAEVWFTTFLVMVFPFALGLAYGSGPQEIRWIAAITSIMVVCCVLATQSRAGLVALVVELWVMAWLIRSRSAKMTAGVVTICLITLVAIVLLSPAAPVAEQVADVASALPVKKGFSSVFHRFDIWAFTLSNIWDHWLVGIGYGSHSYSFLYGQDNEVVMPGHTAITHSGTHNIFLYLALHVGVPGMMLFAWLYYSLIVRTVREYWVVSPWMQKSILGGMVGSLIGTLCRLQFDQMLVGSLATLFWVLVAMAVIYYPSSDGSENKFAGSA